MKTTNNGTLEKKVNSAEMESIILRLLRKYPYPGNSSCQKEKYREFISALEMLGSLTVLEFMRLFRSENDNSIYEDIQKLNDNVFSLDGKEPAYETDELLGKSGVMFIMYCYGYEPDFGLDERVGGIWNNFLVNLTECGEYMYRLTGDLNDIEIFRIRNFNADWECDDDGTISRIKCCPTCGQTLK